MQLPFLERAVVDGGDDGVKADNNPSDPLMREQSLIRRLPFSPGVLKNLFVQS